MPTRWIYDTAGKPTYYQEGKNIYAAPTGLASSAKTAAGGTKWRAGPPPITSNMIRSSRRTASQFSTMHEHRSHRKARHGEPWRAQVREEKPANPSPYAWLARGQVFAPLPVHDDMPRLAG
jgi:hypothetical protein